MPKLEEINKKKDPVCGMELEPQRLETRSEYLGKMYYFCSNVCKDEFNRDPDRYVKQAA